MSHEAEKETFHELRNANPDRVLERHVAKALLEQHIPAFRRVGVDAKDGVVTLRGRVNNFFEKQVARHTCLKVPGVRKVRDGIRVGPPTAAEIAAERAELNIRRPFWKSPALIGVAVANVLCLIAISSFWTKADEFPPTFPVRGKVVIEGEMASGAFVVFHPVAVVKTEKGDVDKKSTPDEVAPQRAMPSGVADKDGNFELTSFRPKDGAPAGDYIVTLQWQKMVVKNEDVIAGPNLVPPAYGKAQLSPLRVKVVEGENKLPTFRISRNPSQGGSPRQM
jgi:hypothetical protein